jgi:nucleoside-diphosphate-sugar epimerase
MRKRMKILVTGGTGVVGTSTISQIVLNGHEVRLVSRHAGNDSRQWPEGVEAWPGDVSMASSVEGAAEGCDAVLHLAGIVDEAPPEQTFDRVNVGGTRNMLAEAERAGVRRFVYVSSLGSADGESPYQQSKRMGEQLARQFSREWVICRPGSVYGPGDDQLSLLLRMVRTLPAVPVIGDGEQPIQPIWHEDLGAALALAAERDDLAGRELDLVGPDMTTQNDLLQRLEKLTAREPLRIPLPDFLASTGIKALGALGIDVPFNDSQMTMLREGVIVADPRLNALTTVLGLEPTPLDEGLRMLADDQAEQLPSEGVGTLKRKRFWADIRGSKYSPEELLEYFRTHFGEVAPDFMEVAAEPGTPAVIAEGETLTLALPLRGHVQVRVAEQTDRRITMFTLEGHPLAGTVRFLSEPRGECARFEVQVYDRAANVVDLLMMRTLGDLLQNRSWETIISNMIEASGGTAERGVERETASLDDEEAGAIERWSEELVMKLKRKENE